MHRRSKCVSVYLQTNCCPLFATVVGTGYPKEYFGVFGLDDWNSPKSKVEPKCLEYKDYHFVLVVLLLVFLEPTQRQSVGITTGKCDNLTTVINYSAI